VVVLAIPVASVRTIIRVIRLRPFDVATEEGRSLERYRRAVLTGITSLLARITTVASALITVPLTIGYLGQDRYGMWLTISSLMAFATVADLGVSFGLQQALSKAHGRDDRDAAMRHVSTAAALLAITTASGGVILAATYFIVPWARVFNVSSVDAIGEAAPAAMAFGGAFLLNVLLGLVTRINDGYQDGVVNNVWQTAGSVVSLLALYAGIRAEVGLTGLMLLFIAGPVVANLINGIVLFTYRRPWLRPRRDHVDRRVMRELVATGFWFLVAALAYAAMQLASTLVIAQILGSSDVPEFGVPQRVAAVGILLIALVVNPLWPAYTEALARGDHGWVRRTLRRALVFVLLAGGAFSLAFIAVGGPLVEWWVDGVVRPSWMMLIGFAVLTLVSGIESVLTKFVVSGGGVRVHGTLWIITTVVGLPTLVGFVRWMGADGVPWALALTTLVCRTIPATYYARRLLRNLARA
jgi:O-antigen/teichoic acid export membrane protein